MGSLETRFWKYVDKSDGCWIWRGAINRNGYGVIGSAHKTLQASRVSYELFVAPLGRLLLRHICEVRLCVSPDHLKPIIPAVKPPSSRKPSVERTCETCGTKFKAVQGRIDKGLARYCSVRCGRAGKSIPLAERFWTKIDKNGPIVRPELGSCWKWMASLDKAGYGQINSGTGTMAKAHRISWEIANGPIPGGLAVLHKCDNPECSRPDHLFLGTNADNMSDAASKRRMPHGESHHGTKLTEAQVKEIIQRYKTGNITQKELAREYGVTRPAILNITRGISWKYVSRVS